MELVADAPAPDPRAYGAAHSSGRLLAAVTADDDLVGFVRIEILDDEPHMEQLSVRPDHQGRGVGAALLQAAEEWARSHGYTRITLTTFRDVSWNGPYYARRGWVLLPGHEWGPGLASARQHERDLGLDQWPRQAMVKHLGTVTSQADPATGTDAPGRLAFPCGNGKTLVLSVMERESIRATPTGPAETQVSHASHHTPYRPEDALGDVDLARDEIVTRGATPKWFHPVIGSGLGLVLLVTGLHAPTALRVVILAGFAALLVAVVHAYRRRSGMLFGLRQATRRGGTILAALVLALMLCAAMVIGGREAGHVWLICAGALLVPVLYTVFGRAYDRQVFRDIRAGRVDAPKRTRPEQ